MNGKYKTEVRPAMVYGVDTCTCTWMDTEQRIFGCDGNEDVEIDVGSHTSA